MCQPQCWAVEIWDWEDIVISACRDLQTPKIGESNKVVLKPLQWPNEGMVNWRRQVSCLWTRRQFPAIGRAGTIPGEKNWPWVKQPDWPCWQSGHSVVIGAYPLKGSHRRMELLSPMTVPLPLELSWSPSLSEKMCFLLSRLIISQLQQNPWEPP